MCEVTVSRENRCPVMRNRQIQGSSWPAASDKRPATTIVERVDILTYRAIGDISAIVVSLVVPRVGYPCGSGHTR